MQIEIDEAEVDALIQAATGPTTREQDLAVVRVAQKAIDVDTRYNGEAETLPPDVIKRRDAFVSNPSDPRHGTIGGYTALYCRCPRCREANRIVHARYVGRKRMDSETRS